MTDSDLLGKKLAFIETCVRDLRELARTELIDRDIREQRFVAPLSNQQTAIDVGQLERRSTG